MMITKHINAVQTGKKDVSVFVKEALEKTKQIDSELHVMNRICYDEACRQATSIDTSGKLAGLVISVKDCICVKDVESTAGSRILEGYVPVFDATSIVRLKKEGAVVLGKTSQDAFGFGSFNLNVGKGYSIPKNPIDISRVTGGSSGGGVALAKAADFPHVAIVESTGGSIECPSAFCGVIGACPTYGRVSRHGLISYADSMDKIGVAAKKTKDARLVLSVMAGHDPSDATSLDIPIDFSESTGKRDFKIAVVKESLDVDPSVRKAFDDQINLLKDAGLSVEMVSMPISMKYGISAYYIIAMSESSTNLSRFSGMRYGQVSDPRRKSFSDYFKDIRTEHFNEESKRRIMLGTFARMAGYRDAYYIKATKVRTLIIEEYKKFFKKYDIILTPTMPVLPPLFSEVERLTPLQHYMMDILTVGPNLSGIPHASFPIGKGKLPVGMMVNAAHLDEKTMFDFMDFMEVLQ